MSTPVIVFALASDTATLFGSKLPETPLLIPGELHQAVSTDAVRVTPVPTIAKQWISARAWQRLRPSIPLTGACPPGDDEEILDLLEGQFRASLNGFTFPPELPGSLDRSAVALEALCELAIRKYRLPVARAERAIRGLPGCPTGNMRGMLDALQTSGITPPGTLYEDAVIARIEREAEEKKETARAALAHQRATELLPVELGSNDLEGIWFAAQHIQDMQRDWAFEVLHSAPGRLHQQPGGHLVALQKRNGLPGSLVSRTVDAGGRVRIMGPEEVVSLTRGQLEKLTPWRDEVWKRYVYATRAPDLRDLSGESFEDLGTVSGRYQAELATARVRSLMPDAFRHDGRAERLAMFDLCTAYFPALDPEVLAEIIVEVSADVYPSMKTSFGPFDRQDPFTHEEAAREVTKSLKGQSRIWQVGELFSEPPPGVVDRIKGYFQKDGVGPAVATYCQGKDVVIAKDVRAFLQGLNLLPTGNLNNAAEQHLSRCLERAGFREGEATVDGVRKRAWRRSITITITNNANV